jgi:outer membrane lipoprotein SlyB
MNSLRRALPVLTGILLLTLTFAGCSKGQEGEAPSTADAQKSQGVLSKLTSSSKAITVPEGSQLTVTLDQAINSEQKSGDAFQASLAAPLTVGGETVIPKGARAIGRIVEARESGRLKGVAELKLELASVDIDGKTYDLHTTAITRTGGSHTKRNVAFIGGGTGAGAVIGGLAGGKKGALIGGAVGAGAGTATAAATGKKEITIPAETALSFKLTQPVTIQVKNKK